MGAENRKTVEKINETKNGFFEKISKVDQSLVIMIREKERRHNLPISEVKEGTHHYRLHKY